MQNPVLKIAGTRLRIISPIFILVNGAVERRLIAVGAATGVVTEKADFPVGQFRCKEVVEVEACAVAFITLVVIGVGAGAVYKNYKLLTGISAGRSSFPVRRCPSRD